MMKVIIERLLVPLENEKQNDHTVGKFPKSSKIIQLHESAFFWLRRHFNKKVEGLS
jgi:hypothetical protein